MDHAVEGDVVSNVGPVRRAVSLVLRVSPELAPKLKKAAWRVFYECTSLVNRWTRLLNYGYAPLEGQPPVVAADGVPYGLQLYAKVASGADLTEKDVLEVGCGRGGGTAFVHEHFHPRTMTGVDLARRAISSCQKTYPRPGLTFIPADAEHLPFDDRSFDIVLNVESSHCYPDMLRFLGEVRRVLRPGGLLLLADARPTADGVNLLDGSDVAVLRSQLAQAGFRTLEEEDITANVLRALELSSPDRIALVEQRVPRPFRRQLHALVAAEGSPMYQAYKEGKRTYLRFVLEPVSG
jgi:SAM-dependent methyltransferase